VAGDGADQRLTPPGPLAAGAPRAHVGGRRGQGRRRRRCIGGSSRGCWRTGL